MQHTYKFNLGDKVVDKVTGFTGTVTGFSTYITGCDNVLVTPPVKEDGTLVDGSWFDDGRLDLVPTEKPTITKEDLESDSGTGAMDPAPIK